VDRDLGVPLSGTPYRFALDESGGTGSGYDRLYLDLNRDGQMAEDEMLSSREGVQTVTSSHNTYFAQEVRFNYVTFSRTDNDNRTHSIEVTPELIVTKTGHKYMNYSATTARQGRIEIAGHQFTVVMSHGHLLGTRWDRPGTSLKLFPLDTDMRQPNWLYSDRLMAMHKIDGTYYRLSTTPAGDVLFVTPYDGPFGTLKVDVGWGLGSDRGMVGTLMTKDTAIAIGDGKEPVRSCRLPVGDYTPVELGIHDGKSLVTVSFNSYAEGQPGGRSALLTYGLKVRQDKTCAMAFSSKLDVMFPLPGAGERIRRGDELKVAAVLVDPKLDVMVRSLRAKPPMRLTSYMGLAGIFVLAIPLSVVLLCRITRRHRFWLSLASTATFLVLAGAMVTLHLLSAKVNPRDSGVRAYDELSPSVTISRDDGQVVAEGIMPYG